jgi:hypothetical protein
LNLHFDAPKARDLLSRPILAVSPAVSLFRLRDFQLTRSSSPENDPYSTATHW